MGRTKNSHVAGVAAENNVTERQARNIIAKQKDKILVPEEKSVGLDGEIARLEKLAASLGSAASTADGSCRSALIADYTRIVESLRKMKGDRPEINQAEGKMVPVDEANKILAARDNALIPLLKGMAKRLAPICGNRPPVEIEAEIEAEVGQVMRQVEAAL